jgi:hypothetical protein
VILPVVGITITRPGSGELAGGETKDPRGRGSEISFDGCGSTNVNVSGDVVLVEYGQTRAWLWERAKA